jgi:C_GCAxxG_C_C family probable redox protein
LNTPQEAIEKARSYFLRDDNLYGCAETTYITLKEAYNLPDAANSAAAMALNGGVAYGGSVCGAISGAALAVGMLAEQRILDHRLAKRMARRIIARLMDQFQAEFHSINCRDLIQMDIRDERQHQHFIESGIWRTRCMQQIEFAVLQLFDLRKPEIWEQVLRELS